MRIGSVCTGVGGLDLGFERAGFEVAWMAEIDPWASRVLEKRWPDVPNVGDWTAQVRSCCWHDALARTFQLEVLVGGIPCQGHSVAGRRGGKDDARNLWPDFAELVDALQPAAFVIENVPGLLTSNDGDFFAEVLEDCDRLGYSVEWDILSAAAVGAPHRRERVFIVGRRDGRQTWPQREQPTLFPGRPQSWPKAGRWTDGTLHERKRQWPTPSGCYWPTPTAQDAARSGAHGYRGQQFCTLTDALLRVPEPRDGYINPPWVETLQGLPVGWANPSEPHPWRCQFPAPPEPGQWWRTPEPPHESPRVVTERPEAWAETMRALGNCVVPQVAEVVARSIAASLEREEEHAHAAR